jgi:tetratricopeptide (TPR) repeat protein
MKPRLGTAWLALGQLLEQAGQKEEAEKDYRLALKNPMHTAQDLALLAQFCQNRGWFREALTNYIDAIKLNTADPLLHMKAGQCLISLGKEAEARQQYAEAVRLAPDSGQAHFLLGVSLGREGSASEAAAQFREAVRLMPDLAEARINLAISLLDQGRKEEALGEFREVLRRSPTNTVALRYVKGLELK